MRDLFFIILLTPTISFSQQNDSVHLILTLPKPPVTSFSYVTEDIDYDLEWADSIIPKINKISVTQLSPLCENKKRKRPVPNHKFSKTDCYMESIIILEQTIVRKDDTTYHAPNKTIVGFEMDKFYREREIDTVDYNAIILATLGKRESYSINMCYNPRHAVVFYDKDNRIIGLYEICFECGNATLGFLEEDLFSMQSDDYSILKELFVKYKLLNAKIKS